MSKLSLCLIVRNEEKHLARCLKSVEKIVDEMIIVDTGSVDTTVQIAKEFGARVVFFPWNNDFSQARNIGLANASGDWVLALDADEALDTNAQNIIHKLLDAPDVEGYFFDIVNYTGRLGDTSSRLVHQSCRLFRKRKAYEYTGRIHEQIVSSILKHKPSAQILKTDLQIHHYGYREGDNERSKKVERNILILQKELEHLKDNAFLEYHLGIGYYELEKKEEALAWLLKSYDHLKPGYAFTPTLIRNIALCLIDLQGYHEAINFLNKELETYPDYTDLLYLRGVAYVHLKQYSRGIKDFQQCLLLGDVTGKYTTTIGTGSYLAYYNLGKAYQSLYEHEKAIKAYTEAVHAEPKFIEPLYALGELLFKKYKNIDRVIDCLEREFNFESTYGLAIMADICGVLRQDRMALTYLERLRKLSEEELSMDLRILYAKSLLGVGWGKVAAEEILEILSDELSPNMLVIELCLAQWMCNPKESIMEIDSMILGRLDETIVQVVKVIDQIWLEQKLQSFEKQSFWSRIKNLLNPDEGRSAEKTDSLDEYVQQLIFVLEKILRYKGFTLFQEASELLLHLNYPQWKLHYQRGELYYRYGYSNEAIEEFMAIIESGVQDEQVYYYLGSICEDRGLFADAENLYCHALNLNDHCFEYHIAAARVALKRTEKLVRQTLQKIPESEYFVRELQIVESCLQKLCPEGRCGQ